MEMAKAVYIGFVSVLLLFCMACGDLQSDEKECASTFQELEPCIGFLQGTGKEPMNGCCTNAKEVVKNNPRCLCLLVMDASDSSSGLSLNQTRLLQMPSLCKVSKKISDCIDTLKLSPSSPQARIFQTGSIASSGSSPSQTTNTKESNWSDGLKPFVGFNGLVLLAAFWFTLF